jgi:hypothetical protein
MAQWEKPAFVKSSEYATVFVTVYLYVHICPKYVRASSLSILPHHMCVIFFVCFPIYLYLYHEISERSLSLGLIFQVFKNVLINVAIFWKYLWCICKWMSVGLHIFFYTFIILLFFNALSLYLSFFILLSFFLYLSSPLYCYASVPLATGPVEFSEASPSLWVSGQLGNINN